jgi:tetratricopeptide (TPR) repeat protein
MPSHIYTRLGHWQESIDWNRRSATAAMKSKIDGKLSMHSFHAYDYIVYAHLQQGEDAKAEEIVRAVDTITSAIHENPATMYALAAMPARLALERHQWDDAATLQFKLADKVNWQNHPAYEAIVHFARGIGGARSGRQEVVQSALDMQDSLLAKIGDSKSLAYWAQQIRIQRMAVAAWQAYSQGRSAEGLEMMAKAAEMEAATEKHPVSPGEILPIVELYGDMLIEAKKPAEALMQYQKSLTRNPNRFNTLYGAAHAAQLTGNNELARTYFAELLKVAKPDTERESVKYARKVTQEM